MNSKVCGVKKIAIIGGGPAAVSVCLQLFNKLVESRIDKPIEIVVYEKNNHIGHGFPYSSNDDVFLINLPKANMEPIFGNSGEYAKWLKEYDDVTFPPRHTFGKYLEHLSEQLQIEADNYDITVQYHTNNLVTNIVQQKSGKFVIEINDEGKLETDYVVLCTGHMPSEMYREMIGSIGYWHSPLSDNGIFASLSGDEDIGIIGSRLTAIDIAVRLQNQQHRGRICMTSRSGLLPSVLSRQVNPYELQYLRLENLPKMIDLDDLIKRFFQEITHAQGCAISFYSIVKSYKDINPLEWIENEISNAELSTKPWQRVLFALYPNVPIIWSRMSLSDQSEFIAKYYSIFMTYLAAFPLDNAYKIRDMLLSGQLIILGGLNTIEHNDGQYTIRTDQGTFNSRQLFNATGTGYRLDDVPLYSKMMSHGLVCQHPLGGMQVDNDTLHVCDSTGRCVDKLFAIGELTRGCCLATTDITRMASQAKCVANYISEKLVGN